MDVKREVTEEDFRMPEFRNAKVEDYEFRSSDQKLVRKDRWQTGIQRLSAALGWRDYEIDEVVDEVVKRLDKLMMEEDSWEREDLPEAHNSLCTLKLECGSILCRATWHSPKQGRSEGFWKWVGLTLDKTTVKQWKLE